MLVTHNGTAVGIWHSGSGNLPTITTNGQTVEITRWGDNIDSATIVVLDFADADAWLGVNLQLPSSFHSPVSQVVSMTRWDTAGGKISDGAMAFKICLGEASSGSDPEFHRYNDGSEVPNDMLLEGGTVDALGTACYTVTTVKTSSLVGFRNLASASPSSNASGDNGNNWYPWLAFLSFPFLGAIVAAVWLQRGKQVRHASKREHEDAYPVIYCPPPVQTEEHGDDDAYPVIYCPTPVCHAQPPATPIAVRQTEEHVDDDGYPIILCSPMVSHA